MGDRASVFSRNSSPKSKFMWINKKGVIRGDIPIKNGEIHGHLNSLPNQKNIDLDLNRKENNYS